MRKNNHLGVSKGRYESLGGMDSLRSLLTATILGNQSVIIGQGEMAPGGAHRSGTPSIVLAQKQGAGKTTDLLALSSKECSFS